MSVPISNVTRRVVYAASGTGPYAFTFEILANTDIEVYKGDTLLTLTTDYTVTINPNGTGSVTLVATAGTDNITIIGARAIQRTSDFVTGGDFFANTVNTELDSLTIFAQQNAEGLARALQAPETDPTTINMTLPRKADRAGKFLAFDAVTGNPVPGETPPELTAVLAIADEIEDVSAIDSEVVTVAGIDSEVTTVAGISSAVSAVGAVASQVSAVGLITTQIVALNTADIAALAPITLDISAVAAIDTTDIEALVNLSTTDLAAVALVTSDIAAIAPITADITAIAALDTSDLDALASVTADISALAPAALDISALASLGTTQIAALNTTDIAALATITADITAVALIDTEVSTVATFSTSDISAIATNVADITNFSDVYLGPKSSDPAVRNDSSALQAGDLYFDTVNDIVKVYTGAVWVAAYVSGDGFLATTGGTMTGNLLMGAQSDVRFGDSDSSNWVAFQGPATVSSNVTWTLPATDGSNGQAIVTDGSGTLSWATAGGISTGKAIAMAIVFG
jgi:trimeric autotransporter adhesin